jgi:hypothetical protein
MVIDSLLRSYQTYGQIQSFLCKVGGGEGRETRGGKRSGRSGKGEEEGMSKGRRTRRRRRGVGWEREGIRGSRRGGEREGRQASSHGFPGSQETHSKRVLGE